MCTRTTTRKSTLPLKLRERARGAAVRYGNLCTSAEANEWKITNEGRPNKKETNEKDFTGKLKAAHT